MIKYIQRLGGYYYKANNTVYFFMHPKNFSKPFIGIAHCSPEDKFNLDKGIKIARYRALIKYHKFLIHCYVLEQKRNQKDIDQTYIPKLFQTAIDYSSLQIKHLRKNIQHLNKKLESLIGL